MRRTLCIIIFLLAIPSIVFAHVYLLECSPEQNAVLDKAPEKVTIAFVGSVETAFSKIEVFNADGTKVSKKTSYSDSDTVIESALDDGIGPGEYTVKWKCMSLDGHMQTGEYKFTIK